MDCDQENVECLCKGFHTPFNGRCPLNTTPENVEEPSLMQVVFNAVEKAKAEWTCSCGATFTHGYGSHLCPDNGHREVRRIKPVQAAATPENVEECWTCSNPRWEIVRGVTCVVCPDCAFTFSAEHTDDTPDGGYSCPNCENITTTENVECPTCKGTGGYHPGRGSLRCDDCDSTGVVATPTPENVEEPT